MNRDNDSFPLPHGAGKTTVLDKDTAAKILGKRNVTQRGLSKAVFSVLNNNWMTLGEVHSRIKGAHIDKFASTVQDDINASLSYLHGQQRISRMGEKGSYKYRRPSGPVAEVSSPIHRLAVIAKKLDEIEAERSRLKHEAKLLAQKL